jgi:hypothetical protein
MFHPVFIGVFFVSMATLAVEVVLTRIFSFSIWYHFAYMTINIALLGFGSSGSILAAFPAIFEKQQWRRLLFFSTLLSSVTLISTFIIFARYPLQPQIIFQQPLKFSASLLLYYLLVSLPFFFAGVAIACSMAVFSNRVSNLYFWDLSGAALGALAALIILNRIGAPGALLVCVFLLLIAACFFASQVGKGLVIVCACLSLAVGGAIPYVKDKIVIMPSGSKVLSYIIKQPEKYKMLYSGWNAVSRVDVYTNVQNPDPPFWGIFGLSNTYKGSFPRFHDMQYDAHNGSNIFQFTGDLNEFQFLDYHLLRAPYVVLNKPGVLIIGVGGGIDVYNALRNDAASITAVELQPITVDLLKNKFADWVSNIFNTYNQIHLIAGEGRNFINRTQGGYDLIQINATDTFAALNTGAYVLMESYLYTEEAIATYFEHLSDNGIISINVGDHLLQGSGQYPPLNTKLILEYLNVLEAQGVADPGQHLVLIGRWEANNNLSCSPLLKKTPFTAADLAKLRAFAQEMGFILIFDPVNGNTPDTFLKKLITASDVERQVLIKQMPYNVTPNSDNNPFFYNFCRWETVYELFNNKKFDFSTPVFGQAVLILLLVQSVVVSFFFILLPLLLSRKTHFTWGKSLGYLIYFSCLGTGFMFMEISFIQKYVLFLGYPAYAFAITLFSLLLFSGVGSYSTGRLTGQPEVIIKKIVIILMIILIAYTILLDMLFNFFIGYNFTIKVFITILSQMPLGLLLGMFFPLGIKVINTIDARMVPWAWGVNGMSSVMSTIIAIILAMSLGFRFVSYAAAVLYLLGSTSLIYTYAVHRRHN